MVAIFMANPYFHFKQFSIQQDRTAMKVSTDACLFGAWAAKHVSAYTSTGRLLDIGTGTGLLSLMLAQQSPLLSIDAVELDAAAAAQAGENITSSRFREQIKLIHADIRTYQITAPYDFIVSNPPFYQQELKSDNQQKNIAHHDEGLLLDELLLIINEKLSAEGRFYLLWPIKREEELLQKLAGIGLQTTRIIKVKQTTAHAAFRLMIEGKKYLTSGLEIEKNEISVKGADDQYTEEFTGLLRHYYLRLG